MGVKLSQVQSLWNGNKWGGEDWGFWVQLVLDSKGSVESIIWLRTSFISGILGRGFLRERY